MADATMPESTMQQLWEARFGNITPAPPETVLDNAPSAGTIRLMLQHRTHRAYTAEPISSDTLNTVLACASSAPSKSDLQQVSIVVVNDPDLRQSIASLIPTMPWIANAATFLVFLADGYRIESICAQRGKPFANDNLDNFLAAVSDASLALQNAITGAEALGLGCCPISVIRDHITDIAQLLKLPRRVIPLAGLCLGYPAREGHVSMRLPPDICVHKNVYSTQPIKSEVDAYDQRRAARHQTPDAAQKYVNDYGVAEFYGWSEDKARQMSKPERVGVGTFARATGFSLI